MRPEGPRVSRLLTGLVMVLLAGAPAAAQEFRGAILGVVADASGAVLPGVTVTVTNVDTNVPSEAVTDGEGRYQVRYLNPGAYTVTASLEGFKTVIRSGVQVGVGDSLSVDLVMSLGTLQETVEVIAYSPVLNTTSGITGQVVESKQIQELPLGDGTAYMLTRLAPGITDSSDLHFSRPADNGNLGGIRANGVQGNNEFSIDGAPNMSNAGGVGFSPPSDAIAEFKVQINAFDAQAGHTAGAVVNLALKSGTNRFRGAASWFNRDDSRASTPLLTERAGGTKPTRNYNRYGATVSGPIVRNKTFFMGSFEHLRDVQPEPAYYTVPTLKMRQGDLSEFGVARLRSADGHRQHRRADGVSRQRDSRGPHRPRGGGVHEALPGAEPAGQDGVELLHQPAPALRLQRRSRAHRPQHQRVEQAVRLDLLEQAAGGSLQLGEGRGQCQRRG